MTHADKPQLRRRSKHLGAFQLDMLVAEAMAQGVHVHLPQQPPLGKRKVLLPSLTSA